MIEKKITTTFYQTNKNSLSKEENSLVDLAINSLRSAYAPYSGFMVGAAVLLENGEIISGNMAYYLKPTIPARGIRHIGLTLEEEMAQKINEKT